MKKLLCLALLVSAGSIYSGSISANNKPTDNKSGNNSKDIYKKTWIDFNKNGIKDVYEDPSAPIEARIADLLSQMTLEEKTCQMATLYGSGRVLKDAWPTTGWSTEIWKDGIGNIDEQANGLGKFGSEISYPYANSVKNRHTIQRWFVEQTRLGIPVDFTNEGIRGLCHDRATMFPAQCGQGATWNKKLIGEIAKVTADEAKALGYTNIYSPILDIAQDPRWGRVVESYGEDPYLVGELGKQMILGLQNEGIVATPKHFAVYSIPVGGRDGGTPQDFILPLRRAINEGKVSLHTLDQRVGEILRVKFMMGLFDNPYPGDDRRPETVVHNDAHKAVSMKAALESIVLLKNENQMLPLSKNFSKIAVIGPNGEEVKELTCRYGPANASIKTVYQGIKEYLPNSEVRYAKGCDIIDKYFPESELYNVPLDTQEQAMIQEAVELAKASDIAILVLGGNEKTVREEFSRTNLDLCGRQQQLLEAVYATGKPVILVMVDGRAATINWANKYIPAIIHAWFPGEFMGDAIAKVLFGDYNPGGRLAVTFPKSVGQIPFAFPFKPGSDSKGKVRVDGVLYPFGYGLSYTTFGYSDLKISKPVIGPQENITLSCTVKNTGKKAGDEVVQLYIRDDFSSVTTYDKVLRGFERIHLQPGEEQTVNFTLTPQDLGLWDKNNRFTVEPGSFSVMVGASSQDIRLKGSFEVQ